MLAWTGAAMLAGTSVFQIVRVREALVPHPLARPFAEATRFVRQNISAGDRVAVVARLPYGMYSRYYGLRLDDRIDEALSPARSPRDTRNKLNRAGLGEGTIWLLCVVPPKREAKQPYAKPTDDPHWIVAAIAERRTLPVQSLDDLDQSPTWKAVVLKIDSQLIRPAPPFVAK
jgi:hypothetical protein